MFARQTRDLQLKMRLLQAAAMRPLLGLTDRLKMAAVQEAAHAPMFGDKMRAQIKQQLDSEGRRLRSRTTQCALQAQVTSLTDSQAANIAQLKSKRTMWNTHGRGGQTGGAGPPECNSSAQLAQ